MPTATVRGPDDDDPSLRPWRGEATEAAAVFFDGDTTRARAWVDAIASDAEATLGERVGEYPAALRKAARVKNGGPKDSNRLHAYCLSILRKGTVSAGEPLTRPGAGGPTAVGPNRWEAVIREGPKHPDYPSAVAETRRILEHVRSSGYAFQIEPDGTTVKTVKTVPPFNEVLPPVVRDELRALKPILLTILAVEAGS